jgi:hypothetical protein
MINGLALLETRILHSQCSCRWSENGTSFHAVRFLKYSYIDFIDMVLFERMPWPLVVLDIPSGEILDQHGASLIRLGKLNSALRDKLFNPSL